MGRGRSAQQIVARVGRLAMQKRTMTTGKKKVGQRAAWACAWHLHANLHCVQGSNGAPRRPDDRCVGAGTDEQG